MTWMVLPTEGCLCATCVKLREVVTDRGEVVASTLEAYRVCATCGGEKMVGDGLLFRPCPTCG